MKLVRPCSTCLKDKSVCCSQPYCACQSFGKVELTSTFATITAMQCSNVKHCVMWHILYVLLIAS